MLAHLVFNLAGQVGVLTQKFTGVVAALADFFAVVGVPGAALFHDLGRHAHVDDLAFAADAFAKQNVELSCLERWRHLVLDHLDLGFVADGFVTLLDGAGAADVQAHRGVELQRVTTGGGFRAAEHHADLHADLVDEDDHAVGLLDGGGELAQRLAHQAGLQARQGIAHFAFDFGLGCEGGHRVHHDQVHSARAHQAVHNLQRLLTGVGLADQQFRQLHPQLLGVLHVQCVLGVHKGASAAQLLHLRNHLQRQRGLARGFRAVNFNHAAAGQATHAQGNVQAQRAGGNHLDVLDRLAFTQAHDRALAELLFDLRQRCCQGLGLLGVHGKGGVGTFDVHVMAPE